jgi:precorrin-2 dehydrogenase/sirohydrochlorin ferrochelatase
MKYYPIFLRVAGRPCLVLGAGRVAEQKVESLLKAGACVTVISPDITARLAALAAARKIRHHARAYQPGDLRGAFLVYAATHSEELHVQIAMDAKKAGVLLNVVDRPQLCDFITPAIVERGDLVVATSTSGASPALAKRIRQQLDDVFGPEYDMALRLLRRVRTQLRGGQRSASERRRIFGALVDSPLLDYLRDRRADEIDRLLAATVGEHVSLSSLGLELARP